jgi:hypothetical protein
VNKSDLAKMDRFKAPGCIVRTAQWAYVRLFPDERVRAVEPSIGELRLNELALVIAVNGTLLMILCHDGIGWINGRYVIVEVDA